MGDAGLPDRVARHDVDRTGAGCVSPPALAEDEAEQAVGFCSGCISPRTVTTARRHSDGQFGDVRSGTQTIAFSRY
ncbi:hypothetical protein GCM10007171_41990 [Dickeya fangzhongdai]|nr:hypothetical protein GCM10007171_41990 [Dickeya fangzhongdai]